MKIAGSDLRARHHHVTCKARYSISSTSGEHLDCLSLSPASPALASPCVTLGKFELVRFVMLALSITHKTTAEEDPR